MFTTDDPLGAALAGTYAADTLAEELLAGSYLRLSALPVAYDPFSPENQKRMTREAAARDGERIPEEFEFSDLDVSGRKDVPRPGLEKALRALLDRRIRTLYVAKLDRLTRRGMAHIGAILDDLEKVGGRIVFIADGLDTSKPGARQVIAILAEQARAESDNISWRIGQWHAHNRRNGLWKQRRPYGYLVERGRLRPHPEEAPIVRRMIEQFLDGASLRSIAIGLNEAGVKSPRLAIWYEEAQAKGNLRAKPPQAGLWAYDTVKTILTQPALAALISHKGQPVYDDDGNLIFAGEGIASVAERARILAEMERRSTIVRNAKAPSRVGKRTGGGRPAKYLLVGLIRCGECGFSVGRWTPAKGQGRPYYRCTSRNRGLPCPGSMILAPYVEKQVVVRFRKKLAALEPGDPLLDVIAERWLAQAVPTEEADRRILEQAKEDAQARIADLYAARYQRGEFQTAGEVEVYESLMSRLRAQRDAAEAALSRLGPLPTVDVGALLDGELSEEGWEALPLARQRDLLKLAIRAVVVYNADEPLEDRFRVYWYDEEPPEPRSKWAVVR